MNLDQLASNSSEDEKLTISHPKDKEVKLTVTLRDSLSFEYKKICSDASKLIFQSVDDKVQANIMLEVIASVKAWDIDNVKCNPSEMMKMFKDSSYEWIACAIYGHVTLKKFVGMAS